MGGIGMRSRGGALHPHSIFSPHPPGFGSSFSRPVVQRGPVVTLESPGTQWTMSACALPPRVWGVSLRGAGRTQKLKQKLGFLRSIRKQGCGYFPNTQGCSWLLRRWETLSFRRARLAGHHLCQGRAPRVLWWGGVGGVCAFPSLCSRVELPAWHGGYGAHQWWERLLSPGAAQERAHHSPPPLCPALSCSQVGGQGSFQINQPELCPGPQPPSACLLGTRLRAELVWAPDPSFPTVGAPAPCDRENYVKIHVPSALPSARHPPSRHLPSVTSYCCCLLLLFLFINCLLFVNSSCIF